LFTQFTSFLQPPGPVASTNTNNCKGTAQAVEGQEYKDKTGEDKAYGYILWLYSGTSVRGSDKTELD